MLFYVKFIWRINETTKLWDGLLCLLFETDYEDDFDIGPATKRTVEGKELLTKLYYSTKKKKKLIKESLILPEVLAVTSSFVCYTKRLKVFLMNEFMREAFPSYWK